jgi:hypothetical protein
MHSITKYQGAAWTSGFHTAYTRHRLIFDALSSDAIEEVEFDDDQVVDRQWILHNLDFTSFRIYGFLDDFGMPTVCPGNLVTRRHNLESDIPRVFYSWYLHPHGHKAQVVYLPIGIVGLVFITEIQQNNSEAGAQHEWIE